MILYEVNLTIANEVFNQYMAWLRPHIQEMLNFEGFIKADIYENAEQEGDKTTIVAAYYVNNLDNLQRYLSEMSASMRADGIKRFGDKCVVTRRILTLTESYVAD